MRGHSNELGPVLPGDFVQFPDLQVSFMDQRGGLQSMIAAFLSQVAGGQSMQLTIDEWSELLQGGLVAVAPFDEPRGYVVGSEHSS